LNKPYKVVALTGIVVSILTAGTTLLALHLFPTVAHFAGLRSSSLKVSDLVESPLQVVPPSPTKDNIIYVGNGGHSCGQWIEDRHNHLSLESLVDQSWVVGYLSAYNEWGPGNGDVSSHTDTPGMVAWIDNYCAGHPVEVLGDVTSRLMLDLEIGDAKSTAEAIIQKYRHQP
jgi:hypothetical protein